MILGAAALAGCGGAPEPAGAGAIAPGTTISAPRYLAVVREAVAAARAASIRVDSLPTRPISSRVNEVAPGIEAAADRAQVAAEQLSAARLDDQRLDDQRREFAPLYVAFAGDLRIAALAAKAGDVAALGRAVARVAVASTRIRAAAAPTGASR